ncbi:hypothetical protein PV328_008406 [Microctonus aethiopoides]|uniref:Uncharacterized protein n=1 Tax=Microctonus aethiopoides TaxID=144406 RepID=A0AA39FJQ8_9HYME|nr:hypothetical protein PV328_008406 [Microctonus aethiopoides]
MAIVGSEKGPLGSDNITWFIVPLWRCAFTIFKYIIEIGMTHRHALDHCKITYDDRNLLTWISTMNLLMELWDLDLTRLGQRAALRYSLMSNRFVVKNKKVTAENCYKAADFGVSLRVHSRWALNALSALKCHFQHWTGMNNERSKRVSAQRECTLSDEFQTIFILISELIESQIQKP